MNPKLKMKAELEEKYRRKYEEKLKQMEAEFAKQRTGKDGRCLGDRTIHQRIGV